MSASKLARNPVVECISQLAKTSASQLRRLVATIQSAGEPVTQPVRQPVTVSVFEATGSILINPWLAGQRAGLADEVVVSVVSLRGRDPEPTARPGLI